MVSRSNTYKLFSIIVVLFAFFVNDAMAQATNLQDASGSMNGLLDLIQHSAGQWEGRLKGFAIRLFWLLAVIQLIWTFFPLVFKQADFGEIVGELLRFILVIGFFYALLLNASEWAELIVKSFRQAGAAAINQGSEMRPGDIFGVAVELANTISDVDTWNPVTAFVVGLAGVIVLICFTFIAAFMGLTIIESYVVINASVLFMGFGASQWTRDFAIVILRYAVAVGAKLFVLTLLVGLIIDSAKLWQAAYNHNNASMLTMVGLAFVCAYLSKTIPELIGGLISGTSSGGGAVAGSMAAVAAAGAVAAIAATGGASAAAAGAEGVSGEGASASGGGGGGLANSISSSIANHAGNAASSITSGDSDSGKVASSTPKIGGGSGGAKPASAAADSSSSPAQTKKEAPKSGSTARNIASGTISTTGILSAIAVPGMESSAGLSLGEQSSTPPPSGEKNTNVSMEVEESENIIRPSSEPAPSNDDTKV